MNLYCNACFCRYLSFENLFISILSFIFDFLPFSFCFILVSNDKRMHFYLYFYFERFFFLFDQVYARISKYNLLFVT